MDKFSYIANADGAYLESLYQSFKEDPASVDESWRFFFEGFDFSRARYGEESADVVVSEENLEKEFAVRKLINAYRLRGHLQSRTNPVRERMKRPAHLELSDFGLTKADLGKVFSAGKELGLGTAPLSKILDRLKKIYEGPMGFDFMSIRDPKRLAWFRERIEEDVPKLTFTPEEKTRILYKLNEAVVFENFLHTKYIGQKRFSLEGGESTIPALDALINYGADLGVEECVIGMAHRGRLNVLTNIMGKTYEEIFSEFEGSALPEETMGDGDVKYHIGFSSQIKTPGGKSVRLQLMPNPSHLEAIDPVVVGTVRAKGDTLYGGDRKKILPILIHGDAAIAGQGVVYEVVQMSELRGYDVGGTIHFVINNQVGFTTDFQDARSAIYCTDLSNLVGAPSIHVNGDNPEAVVAAVKLAVAFRQRYQSDIFIDMVCYRRHGHNESDEPKFTQPKLYNIISKHPNPREIYSKKLAEGGQLDAQVAEAMDKKFRKLLDDRLNEVRQHPLPYKPQPLEEAWKALGTSRAEDFEVSPPTSISEDVVAKVGKALIKLPENFKALRQIERLIKDREQMFFGDKPLNWAAAELLAYGSLLLENKAVRMSGQDVERGTFSHRHAVLSDANTNEKYLSLNHIAEKQQKFLIYNSNLSEYAVLGFEMGYSMANPHNLTIWEAQFGDFANGAQVMIDQFITSCESKWNRMSGLVMLLPHGYEGQGPEHSNARPERFLQLAAEDNIVVANITTPANLFHFLRRQLAWNFRKPAILMSPKSLLRHPEVVSSLSAFTEGKFEEIYEDHYARPYNKVEKILLCTGKVYFDLRAKQQADARKDVAIIRLEQLHPFPEKRLNQLLAKYKNAKTLVWVQEEPVNMGYWTYILRTFYARKDLKLVARKPSASPATGYSKIHLKEQENIVKAAFKK